MGRERVPPKTPNWKKGKEMSNIRAVIFDFDGVLVDSEVISLSELQRALAFYGIEKNWDELVEGFLGHSNSSIGAYIQKETGKDLGEEFPNRWIDRILQRFSEDLALMPGATALLDLLDEQNIPYCIASGSSPKRLRHALEIVGITDRFQGRLFSSELVEKGKPAPDIFLYALEALGVDASEALVIEDGVAGTVGAKAAGIASIFGFVGGSHLTNCWESHAAKLKEAGASPVAQHLNAFESILRSSGP